MDEYWKRSGQMPTFGNWNYVKEFPITHYFENARQAGLIRYGSSSGETDPYLRGDDHDLYTVDFKKPVRKATRVRNQNAMVNGKETRMRKQGKVYDVKEHPKPVDEDLYKIPPELLPTTKRKKMLGFISNCLVPTACVS